MTVDREGFTTVDYRQDGALGFMDDVRDREIDMNLNGLRSRLLTLAQHLHSQFGDRIPVLIQQDSYCNRRSNRNDDKTNR